LSDDIEKEIVFGARVRDQLTREEWNVHAKCVVNATGPYTDDIRKMDDPSTPNICQPSAGVHIVLPEYYR
jgi:glycerol-3-phosphate dehydrogenase